jgi:pSer/pThr/pTyr-binding forkhead associated (FHA) protein/outer membrane biosynthesis protein TonB
MTKTTFMPKLQLISQNGEEINVETNRFFIGSAACCDLVIKDHFIHNIHALIFFKDNQFFVQDLHTSSGLFVDGVKIKTSALTDQVQLNIGSFQFQIFIDHETNNEIPVSPNQDEAAEVFSEFIENSIPEDFKFDDTPLSSIRDLIHRDQIKFELNSEIHAEIENVSDIDLLETTESCYTFDVTINIGECVYQHQQIKMNKQNLRARDICAFAFNNHDQLIANCHDNYAQFLLVDDYELFNSEFQLVNDHAQIKIGEHLIYRKGAISIVIKLLEINQQLKPMKIFEMDRELNKILAGLFGLFFIPLLSLLLLSQEKPEKPQKEVAIIYQMHPTDQPPAPTVAAKAEQNNDMAPKPQTTPNKPNPVKTVETQSTQSKPVKNEPVVVKKFAFKSEVQLDQVEAKDIKLDHNPNQQMQARSPSSVKAINFADSKNLGRINGKIEGLASGSDRGKIQAGGKLSDKNSFDSSYIEPRTVVLGSIDPELLRKILREYIPQFRHCYQQELLQNDQIKGILDLDFTITQVGKAAKINVLAKDSRFSGKGQDCMKKVLSLIDFPKPKGGGIVEVRQPLNFMAERRQL